MFKIIRWGHFSTMLWCVSNVFFLIFVESTTEEHFSSEKRAKANRVWWHLMCHYKFTGWVFVTMVRKSLCVLKKWQVMCLVIHVGEKTIQNNYNCVISAERGCCTAHVLYIVCIVFFYIFLFYFFNLSVTAALIILIFCLAWSLHTTGALHYRQPTFIHGEWTYSLGAFIVPVDSMWAKASGIKAGCPCGSTGSEDGAGDTGWDHWNWESEGGWEHENRTTYILTASKCLILSCFHQNLHLGL